VLVGVPQFGELDERDRRLMRLAEALGVVCQAVPLEAAADPASYLKQRVPEDCTCLVIHPRVFARWLKGRPLDRGATRKLVSGFTHVLVHGLRADDFDNALVGALSGGSAKIEPMGNPLSQYAVSLHAGPMAEAFAGETFGPVNSQNDRVIRFAPLALTVEELILIDDRPFMARTRMGDTEVFFIAGDDVADLDRVIDVVEVEAHFSRLLPHAMVLRHAAGAECWRPVNQYASLVIDDPLLRMKYGYLNYEHALAQAKQWNFHIVTAFIPLNYRRSSADAARIFRENADRLSICVHGNDHAHYEFASRDTGFLNASYRSAIWRTQQHFKLTGVRCDPVMVFPLEGYSEAAMRTAKLNNLEAVVCSTTRPMELKTGVTLGELCRPAVVRYGGFPLFLRNSVAQMRRFDVAFRLFFGRPILIGEHHDIFKQTDRLLELVRTINSMAPNIHWANLATVTAGSMLVRKANGKEHVRGHARTLNPAALEESENPRVVEWAGFGDADLLKAVEIDGKPASAFTVPGPEDRIAVEVPAGARQAALVYRSSPEAVPATGLRWRATMMAKRRLSEFRDNYLSKNERILASAKAIQRRILNP